MNPKPKDTKNIKHLTILFFITPIGFIFHIIAQLNNNETLSIIAIVILAIATVLHALNLVFILKIKKQSNKKDNGASAC